MNLREHDRRTTTRLRSRAGRFSSLKAELVHHTRFASIGEARVQIFHYIEAFYNRKRLHSARGYRSRSTFKANAMTGS